LARREAEAKGLLVGIQRLHAAMACGVQDKDTASVRGLLIEITAQSEVNEIGGKPTELACAHAKG